MHFFPEYLRKDCEYWPAKDTSWQAWATVLAAMVVNGSALALLFTFGLFVIPLAEDFGVGRGEVSIIVSVGFLMGGFSGMAAGLMSKRFGSQPVIVSAGFGTVIGGILTSYATALWQIYISFGILVGMSVSFAATNSVSTVSTWFVKYRGIGIGLASCGAGIGQLISPFAAQALLDTDGGNNWRAANRWLGVGCGTLLIISGCFVRTRPREAPDAGGKLVEMVQVNTKAKEISSSSSSDEAAAKAPGAESTSSSSGAADSGASTSSSSSLASAVKRSMKSFFDPLRAPLKTPYYRNFLMVAVCAHFAFNIPNIHIPAWVADGGGDENNSALILTILGGAQVAGRLVHGVFADRYGTLNGMTIGVFLMGLFTLLWPIVPYSFGWAAVFAIVHGLNLGTLTTHASSLMIEYFHSDPAALVGTYFTVGAPLGFLGPTTAGFIFDAYGSYFRAAFLTSIPLFATQFFLFRMRLILRAEKAAALKKADDDESDSKVVEISISSSDGVGKKEAASNGVDEKAAANGVNGVHSSPEKEESVEISASKSLDTDGEGEEEEILASADEKVASDKVASVELSKSKSKSKSKSVELSKSKSVSVSLSNSLDDAAPEGEDESEAANGEVAADAKDASEDQGNTDQLSV